jgi:hypothetical protein
MSATAPGLWIEAKFNGPSDSGNGGIAAGRLAARLSLTEPVEVRLRQRIPLQVPIDVEIDGDAAIARYNDAVVASARRVGADALGDPVEPVSYERAVAAALAYPGDAGLGLNSCFGCGGHRPARDGLELFAGPIDGNPRYRATGLVLRPEHEPGPDTMWAALDCPGGWAQATPGRPALLGTMTALIREVAPIGEPCVVVAVMDGRDGRKGYSRTTAYGSDGRELGRASQTWIEIAPQSTEPPA